VADVTPPLFSRVVAPVANTDDASATAAALRPHVTDAGATVVALHVIEKASGALDKASVEQREREAEALFETVAGGFADLGVDLETELQYGTDVAATIVDAAMALDASAIVFTPRGGSRWEKLLSGDVTYGLLEESSVPIVVLPDRAVDDSGT